jgi:hypothetical protein
MRRYAAGIAPAHGGYTDAITDAIDKHVKDERGQDDDGTAVVPVPA